MEHKPEVLLIDVDENLTNEMCYTVEECRNATPDQEMINWVNKQYDYHLIVICTARRHALYEATIEWLARHGVKYHNTSFDRKPPGRIVDRRAINSCVDKI